MLFHTQKSDCQSATRKCQYEATAVQTHAFVKLR